MLGIRTEVEVAGNARLFAVNIDRAAITGVADGEKGVARLIGAVLERRKLHSLISRNLNHHFSVDAQWRSLSLHSKSDGMFSIRREYECRAVIGVGFIVIDDDK